MEPENIEQVRSQDLTPAMIEKESKPKKTWFFERGDGFIFAAEEPEAWEIMYNRSTWKRRDFKMLGVSDGTTYKSIVSKGKSRAIALQNEVEAKLKEMQQYQKALNRLLIDEAVDMEDPTDPVNVANIGKVKRLQTIIGRMEKELSKAEDELKNLTKNLIKEATDAEVEKARGHMERPRRVDVITPNASSEDRQKIVSIMDGRVG